MKSHGSGISVNINAQGGHGHHCPPDHDVLRVLDLATRDAIPPQHRHEGMWVLVLEDMTFYRLTGGLTNDCWVVCGGGHGGEISPDDLPIASKTEKGIVQIGENIGVDANGLIAVAKASEDAAGVVELASAVETKAGTDITKAVTPAGLADALVQDKVDHPLPIASKTEKGIVQIGENIGVDANGLIAVARASADTIGVVKGGDNVAIAADGTLSVPDVIDMLARGFGRRQNVELDATTTPSNDFNQLWDVNLIASVQSAGQLNGPDLGAGLVHVYGAPSTRIQVFFAYSGKMAMRTKLSGVVSGWHKMMADGCSLSLGKIDLLPYRAADLPVGWHVCNGGGFDISSEQGKALAALPANFKTDWKITTSGSTIYKPNLLTGGAVSGQGPFFRPSNSVPGIITTDAIRNITGELSRNTDTGIVYVGGGTTYLKGAFAVGTSKTNYPAPISGAGSTVLFDASLVVPTAAENRPLYVAMTAAIWLGC